MTDSSRPNPVEQPVMNQTGLEWASAMTASDEWIGGRRKLRTTPPESATSRGDPCCIDVISLPSNEDRSLHAPDSKPPRRRARRQTGRDPSQHQNRRGPP